MKKNKKEKIMEKFITKKKAAEIAGVSTQTISNWSNAGLITVRIIGKSMYVERKSLDELLRGNTMEKVVNIRELKERLRKEEEELYDKIKFITKTKRRVRFFAETVVTAVVLGMKEYNGASAGDRIVSSYETSIKFFDMIESISKSSDPEYLKMTYSPSKKDFKLLWKTIRSLREDGIVTLDKLKNKSLECCQKDLEIKRLKAIIEGRSDDIENEVRKDRVKLLETPILREDFTVRVYGVLCSIGVKTIKDLVSIEKPRTGVYKNLGQKSIGELDDMIELHGLCWSMDIDNFIMTGEARKKRED